jgi:hypothetical protein
LRELLPFVMILFISLTASSQPLSNLRQKTFSTAGQSIRLDSFSLVPNSVKISNVERSDYTIDHPAAMLFWIRKPSQQTVSIEYRVFPFSLTAATRRMSFDSIFYRFNIPGSQLTGKKGSDRPIDFGKINSNGSLGRSLSFGNRQDAVFNSSLNLQLNGYMGDSILINAAISDNNIPIQPDGNTQNLNEFDQVYIRFSKDNWKLSVGDLDIRQSDLYYLNFYKRLQGLSFETENRINTRTNNSLLASGAIAKGKFTRNIFQGVEGNQGPYRLKGANQEQFFIVLAGTERVFIDGQMMQRGEDQDYTINYNTAEITFMQKQMISKDKRIQVEFEYADRNYLNTQLFFNNKLEINKKLQVSVGYFGNGDARNSPINQTLNANQKQFLSDVGDNTLNAFYPSAVEDTFATGNILYQKIDSTYAVGKKATVYVYQPAKRSDLYSLSFIDVGAGAGNYVIDPNAAANGKVYKWIAPNAQTGAKSGNYEPVVLLVAPKKQSLVSVATTWNMNNQTQLVADMAVSRFDLNRFSSKDKSNDDGYAARLILKNKKNLQEKKGLSLESDLNLEYASATFRPIERLRSVEFTRDWGLDLMAGAATEKILNASFLLENKQSHQLKYLFGSYARNTDFNASRHQLEHHLNQQGWIINNQVAITSFKDEIKNGIFFRPTLSLAKRISSLRGREIGLAYAAENTVSRFNANDSITPGSFAFSTFQLYTQSDPTQLNKWGIKYFTRSDDLPDGKQMLQKDHSNNLNINGEWMSNDKHRVRFNATYRKLNLANNIASIMAEESMLGRLEYFTDLWKGAIAGNALYELGGGQEPRREFTYIEVPVGQGEYTWIDFNSDGIQQLNEFEVAKFRDQAKFLRIFTPTNEFIRSNNLQFNYNLIFNPSIALDGDEGSVMKAFLKRLYLQSALQVSQKQLASGERILNPFRGMIQDTSLITFDQVQSHSASFNKFSQLWGMDLNFLQSSNRAFLSYGYETRRLRDLSLKIRSNWLKMFTLDLIGRLNRNILETPNFGNRNFNILSRAIEPRITFTKGTTLRLQSSYKWDKKQNKGPEKALINSLNLEGKYNLVSNTSITSRITFSNIQFNGIASSSLGYVMLDGLQPGKNFLWTMDLTKRISSFIEMSVQYEGRRSGSSGLVNIGRAQIRAIL